MRRRVSNNSWADIVGDGLKNNNIYLNDDRSDDSSYDMVNNESRNAGVAAVISANSAAYAFAFGCVASLVSSSNAFVATSAAAGAALGAYRMARATENIADEANWKDIVADKNVKKAVAPVEEIKTYFNGMSR